MKPTARMALDLLRSQRSVTTHEFLAAGVGSRFGARLLELRELGFVIGEERLPLPTRGSRYTLTHDPERDAMSAQAASMPRESAADPAGSLPRAAGDGSLFDPDPYRAGGGYRDVAA